MIDEIDTHVDNTAVAAKQGDVEMGRAIRSALSAKKSKWIIFWIVLVILLIAAGVIAYFVVTNKSPIQ